MKIQVVSYGWENDSRYRTWAYRVIESCDVVLPASVSLRGNGSREGKAQGAQGLVS